MILAAVVLDGKNSGLQFGSLTGVGNGNDHIACSQLAAGAMNGFGAVQIVSRIAGRRQQGCYISSNMAALADAGNMDRGDLDILQRFFGLPMNIRFIATESGSRFPI